MSYYKRKITLDKGSQILQFDNGESYLRTQYDDLVRLTLSGFTITGITSPDKYILISFKQKIKDLGIYDDINTNNELVKTTLSSDDIISGLLNRR